MLAMHHVVAGGKVVEEPFDRAARPARGGGSACDP